jgi:hypothetical protein
VLASIHDEHKAKKNWNKKVMCLPSESLSLSRTDPLQEEVFSQLSALFYNPLGFLAPFLFKAKQMLQELCKLKLGWDEVIPEKHSISWKTWLSAGPAVQIDRCMMPENIGTSRPHS